MLILECGQLIDAGNIDFLRRGRNQNFLYSPFPGWLFLEGRNWRRQDGYSSVPCYLGEAGISNLGAEHSESAGLGLGSNLHSLDFQHLWKCPSFGRAQPESVPCRSVRDPHEVPCWILIDLSCWLIKHHFYSATGDCVIISLGCPE